MDQIENAEVTVERSDRTQVNKKSRTHYVRNLGIAIFFGGLLGLLVIGVVMASMQLDALLAPSISLPQETPADYGMSYTDVELVAQDGMRLAAWFVSSVQTPSEAVVIVHGLGSNRGSLLPTATMLHDHDYAVLLLDLRAHGESRGEFKSFGYYEALDVLAAVDYLVANQGIPAARVGLIGHSLGGAAVIRAASLRQTPHPLIVVSTYQSLEAAIEDAFDDFAALPSWPFEPIITWAAERRLGLDRDLLDLTRMLKGMTPRPTLLIHGTADDILPLYHHQALCRAAPWATCWELPGMGHESPARFDPETYEERMIGFFNEALLGE